MADKEWELNMAAHKAERIMDMLGYGPLDIEWVRLTKDRIRSRFTPAEREYMDLIEDEEILTVRNGITHELKCWVNVTGEKTLAALAALWALLAEEFGRA